MERHDVRNSKLIVENFEFHHKKILSKDEFSKYLMETQTTVLNVVTWVKNQKKSREEIQKINVPHDQQQNQQRQHIQHVFFT